MQTFKRVYLVKEAVLGENVIIFKRSVISGFNPAVLLDV
jgi:hypothetical protein